IMIRVVIMMTTIVIGIVSMFGLRSLGSGSGSALESSVGKVLGRLGLGHGIHVGFARLLQVGPNDLQQLLGASLALGLAFDRIARDMGEHVLLEHFRHEPVHGS